MAYAQTLTPRPGLGLPGTGALVVLALGTIAKCQGSVAAQSRPQLNLNTSGHDWCTPPDSGGEYRIRYRRYVGSR